MNDAQTKQELFARLGEAYLETEAALHDLTNMAGIATSLFDGIRGIMDENSGLMTIKITKAEFARLQFAIYRTDNMASDLLAAFDDETADKSGEKPLGGRCLGPAIIASERAAEAALFFWGSGVLAAFV